MQSRVIELPLPFLAIARFFGAQQTAVAKDAVPQETPTTTARLLNANAALFLAFILIGTDLLTPPI
jgi:hypothetical protein